MPGKFVIKKGPTGKFRFSLVDERPDRRLEPGVPEQGGGDERRSVGSEASGRRADRRHDGCGRRTREGGPNSGREEARRKACREEAGRQNKSGGEEEVGRAGLGWGQQRHLGNALSRSAASWSLPTVSGSARCRRVAGASGEERLEVVCDHLPDAPPLRVQSTRRALRSGGWAFLPGDARERLEPRTLPGKICSGVLGDGSTRITRRRKLPGRFRFVTLYPSARMNSRVAAVPPIWTATIPVSRLPLAPARDSPCASGRLGLEHVRDDAQPLAARLPPDISPSLP